VQKGDTLEKIAKKYSVSQDELLEYNELADAPETPKTEYSASTKFAISNNQNIPASAKVPPGSRLLWPTTGRKINQYPRIGHIAVDIGGDYSSPIYAADSGRVEATNKGRGYGNDIIINHGGGKKTLYAHLSKIFVHVGDNVEKGQTMGMMGCTGWCTGTHLHFEVIINGSKVNPLSYL
jgi:murein DD-endopeptidase MepM/ murein hydrolase activator NlpD